MPIVKFPDPRKTGPDGLLALGGDLDPESLTLAYQNGIFPWPVEGLPLAWFSPPERAILDFSDLHIPRSLKKAQNRSHLKFTIDQAFERVIEECSRVPRPGQSGTWITPEMAEAYREFHRLGQAHSLEAWNGDRLVGGIYGVAVAGTFAGESMFHSEPNASKLALLALIEHLQNRGLDWIDIQMLTPHMEALGAKTISRDLFLSRLAQTQSRNLRLF